MKKILIAILLAATTLLTGCGGSSTKAYDEWGADKSITSLVMKTDSTIPGSLVASKQYDIAGVGTVVIQENISFTPDNTTCTSISCTATVTGEVTEDGIGHIVTLLYEDNKKNDFTISKGINSETYYIRFKDAKYSALFGPTAGKSREMLVMYAN